MLPALIWAPARKPAPLLAPELGLSPFALGVLLSAFFWTYAAGQLGAAWLVDRIEVRWAYAAGFLIWSLATLSTAAVSTFSALLFMRLLLGLGEAVAYTAPGIVAHQSALQGGALLKVPSFDPG